MLNIVNYSDIVLHSFGDIYVTNINYLDYKSFFVLLKKTKLQFILLNI